VKDISIIAAFPKSGITFLNYMLFHVLFDCQQNARLIDSDYIFDVHESLARVPPPGEAPRYLKMHFAYGAGIPLYHRAGRAVCLVRDPIDVMMSVWDFKHLTDEDRLLEVSPAERAARFQAFCRHWLTSGGLAYPFAGSWVHNVASWLDQSQIPLLVVRYERLKEQPFAELQRVLRFLGRDAPDQRIAAAVEAGKVDNMRQRESEEISKHVSGVFYRPSLAKGYAHGYRFVGRLNQSSYDKVLNPATRQYADQVFGPILRRVRARAE
jgi:hypothetical protein